MRCITVALCLLIGALGSGAGGVVGSGVQGPGGERTVPPPAVRCAPLEGQGAADTGVTYFVRPDGGSVLQCSGLADAPYPGSGEGQACAWDHPFRALPPGGPLRLAGGDTLIVGAGSYRMGFGAPGIENSAACAADYPWDCHMPPLPSGPDALHPTRILGAGWENGCSSPPELWGAERAARLLDLSGAAHIEIACLEITDHAACVDGHSGGLACPRAQVPYGDWAAVGLYAEDAADVHLRDLIIHGLAVNGVHAGRLTDWTVERVRIVANGWAGWDGDISGEDANRGTLTFRHLTVAWNGCAESFPDAQPAGCWAQSAGGYGDGFGTGATGGDWLFEDSSFLHNTSDGLDLLYHELGGALTLRRVRAEGNAGNPVKLTGDAQVENSVLVANCAFFDEQPFTYDVDACRALGNALELSFMGGETVDLLNNTFYGQGDGLVSAGAHSGGACSGSEQITGRNNLFLGGGDYFDPGDLPFLFYTEGCGGLRFEADYSLYDAVKLSAYTPAPHDLATDPFLQGPLAGEQYAVQLSAASPAIDAGDPARCPDDDIDGLLRPIDGNGDGIARCDIGAYEWRPLPTTVHLPLVANE